MSAMGQWRTLQSIRAPTVAASCRERKVQSSRHARSSASACFRAQTGSRQGKRRLKILQQMPSPMHCRVLGGPHQFPTVACLRVPGHAGSSLQIFSPSREPANRPASALRSSVYHFSETATDLFIKGFFNAVSAHNFIMHQRIKLVFQQVPFSGRRHLSRLST